MFGLPDFVDVYFISVLVFVAVIAVLVYRDRKKFEFHFILMMRKTQRGKRTIDRIAQLSPRAWKIISTIGVIAAFGGMAYGIFIMSMGAKLIVDRTLTVPSLQFVVPLPSAQPSSGPGYLLVPFWFWIILIPFFMFPHEIAHGIVARAHKIRLKSVGVLLLAIIPGAFVEPDDRQVSKSKAMTKLRIFGAGSVANIVFVLLFSLFASQVIWPSMIENGLEIVDVNATSPAYAAGIRPEMRLDSIGGQAVDVTYDDYVASYSLLLFTLSNLTTSSAKYLATAVSVYDVLSDYSAGQTVDVVADGTHYQLTLAESPTNSTLPYTGMVVSMDEKRSADFEYSTLLPLIWWLTTVGYGVAIFNLLPVYPLDGGLMVQTVVEKFMGRTKKSKRVVTAISIAAAALVAFNFIGPYLMRLV
jgi:membrane-associated protease RseP (regulator of RpoE activity)